MEKLLHVSAPILKEVVIDNFLSISIEKQMLAVIWLLATPDSYRSVSLRFGIEKSSLSIIFFRIVKILCRLAPDIIKLPKQNEIEQKNIMRENVTY